MGLNLKPFNSFASEFTGIVPQQVTPAQKAAATASAGNPTPNAGITPAATAQAYGGPAPSFGTPQSNGYIASLRLPAPYAPGSYAQPTEAGFQQYNNNGGYGSLFNSLFQGFAAPIIQTTKTAVNIPWMAHAALSGNQAEKDAVLQSTYGTTNRNKALEKNIGATAGTIVDAAAPEFGGTAPLAGKIVGGVVGGAVGGAGGAATNGGSMQDVLSGAGTGTLFGAGLGLLGGLAGSGGSEAAQEAAQVAEANSGKGKLNIPQVEAKVPEPAPVVPTERPVVAPTSSGPAVGDAAAAAKAAEVNSGQQLNIPDELQGTRTGIAAQKLHDLYTDNGAQNTGATTVKQLIGSFFGRSRRFFKAANGFKTALNAEFTPEENQIIRDNLEGVANPEDVTPRIQAATDVAKQLNDRGFDVLSKSDGDLNKVTNYSTRLSRRSASGSGTPVQNAVSDIRDLFNVKSDFSNSRQVGKFVDQDGNVVFGTPKDLGIKARQDGTFDNGKSGANKVTYQPAATSAKELNANGFNYENSYGKTAQVYHTNVGRAKAAEDMVQALRSDPEKYGLSRTQQEGMVPVKIAGHSDLDGLYATEKDASAIADTIAHNRPQSLFNRTLLGRAYRGATNTVIQNLVFNPLIHVRNLNEMISGATGRLGIMKGNALAKYKGYIDYATMGNEGREELHARMRDAGVEENTYGTDQPTVVSNVLDKAGIPHVNKISPKAMASLDWDMRGAAFHLLTKGGALSDREAAEVINKFVGDRMAQNDLASGVGQFWHYLNTRLNIVKEVASHPITNRGAIFNYAMQAAITYGVSQALLRQVTGNPNASVGNPGLFGLVNDANNLRQGRFGAVISSNLNPLLTTGFDQLTGQQLYNETANGYTGSDVRQNRVGDLESTLFGPSQYTSKVNNGKASVAEEALAAATGVKLPHEKGTPAAPNLPGSVLNTAGSKAAADQGNIHDPTGVAQTNAYFDNVQKIQQSLSGPNDTHTLANFNAWLSRNKDPDTGQTIQSGPKESADNWSKVANDDGTLKAVQKFEQGNANHNPAYDLSPDQLKKYAQYEAALPGSSERSTIEQQNPWIVKTFNDVSAWGNKQVFSGNAEKAPDYVPYPTLSDDQNNLMDQAAKLSAVTNRSPAQQAALTGLYANPSLAAAYNSLDSYTNSVRQARGASPIPYPPALTPQEEAMFQQYEALPTGTGAKTAFINNNAAAWNGIQSKLAASTMFNIEKQGGLVYAGGTSDSLNKDVYNAGKYDITKGTNPDGSAIYALATNQNGGSTGSATLSSKTSSSYGPYTKSSSGSSSSKKSSLRSFGYAKGSQAVDSATSKFRNGDLPKVRGVRKASSVRKIKTGVVGLSNAKKPKVSLKTP